jgi:hypothetical protein
MGSSMSGIKVLLVRMNADLLMGEDLKKAEPATSSQSLANQTSSCAMQVRQDSTTAADPRGVPERWFSSSGIPEALTLRFRRATSTPGIVVMVTGPSRRL